MATNNPSESLGHVVIGANTFSFILATVAVGLRLWSRKITKKGLFLDDFLIIAGLIILYGILIAGFIMTYNGLGKHIVDVPPDTLVVYLKTLFTGSFLYTGCITCIKLSVLALYHRIFPIRPMAHAVYVISLIVVLWCFGGCLIGAVVCIPTKKLWYPQLPGGCIDLPAFYYGLQIPNILTDAVIILMPVRVVLKLPISRPEKALLSLIFVLGALTFIFDIIRLVALIDLSQSGDDVTYNQVAGSVWTSIEPAVGITAACLTNMRPLFRAAHARGWVPWRLQIVSGLRSPSRSGILGQGYETGATGSPPLDPWSMGTQNK